MLKKVFQIEIDSNSKKLSKAVFPLLLGLEILLLHLLNCLQFTLQKQVKRSFKSKKKGKNRYLKMSITLFFRIETFFVKLIYIDASTCKLKYWL